MRPRRMLSSLSGVLAALVVAFALVSSAAGGTETVLYSFQGTQNSDGQWPFAGLVFDKAGHLFGTNSAAGEWGAGTVFELVHSKLGWKETVLQSFSSGGAYGATPVAPLVFNKAGHLYGMTGSSSTVFEFKHSSGIWTERLIYNGGPRSYGPVVVDSSGNLYGTLGEGGLYGCGTVFKLTHSKSGWTSTVLYNFTGSPDGCTPAGGLVLDQAGNLYGTTALGGTYFCDGLTAGCGVVFELTRSKGGWTETVLHNFNAYNGDGDHPAASLVFDGAGNLYGTAQNGGIDSCTLLPPPNPGGCGTVFELTPNPSGGWTETTLYAFTGGSDGGLPVSVDLIFDQTGNLYGTTELGGVGGACGYNGAIGCGTVFKLTQSAGSWTESVLYNFCSAAGCSDGEVPYGGLIFDQAGNLYGTTVGGGSTNCRGYGGCGVVFKITP